jgi:hypothetical protein
MNSSLTISPSAEASPSNGSTPLNGSTPASRKSLSFDEVYEQVQDDERGKWDTLVRRQDIVSKDGKIAFPLDPLGEYWETLTPTPWATGQLCSQLGIPTTYYRKCPSVLQDIQLNYWLRPPLPASDSREKAARGEDGFDFTPEGAQSKGLEQTYTTAASETSEVAPEQDSPEPATSDRQEQWLLRARHGTLRAVLSERYSPLDNPELLKCLVPVWQEHFRIDWFALGDETLHLRIVDPTLVMEGLPQDDLMAGVHLSNSEVGKRAVTVDALVFRLVCQNGLIRQVKGKSLLRQRHIHITHERFHEQLEGAVREGMNIAAGFMSQLALTARQPVPDVEETLKRLGERWHLSQGVQESALHAMRQEPAGVQETVYGLVNGLTRAAQELSMDHRYDLEVLAGRLAEQGLPSWARSGRIPLRQMSVARLLPPTLSQPEKPAASSPLAAITPLDATKGDATKGSEAEVDAGGGPVDVIEFAQEMFQAEVVSI